MQICSVRCPIKLNQFLKIIGAGTGGQGKLLVQMGKVKVDGIIVYQRNKNLYAGAVVDVENMGVYQIEDG